MRKSYFAIIALGALVIASCQKENSADLPKVDSPVFTATLDADSDTKTVLVEIENVKKSHWVSGDAIRVLNGTNIKGCDAVYTTTDEGASATFKTDDKGFTGTEFVAMYPATPAGSAWWNAAADKTVNKLWLKPVQTAEAGGYDPEAHIAVAYSETTSLEFKNAVSLLKFTIAEGSKEVSAISVSVPTPDNGSKSGYIAGNFNYDTKSSICYNEGGSLSTTVALTGTFVAGQTYYMAVLPGTYASLTLKVNDKEYKTKSTPSEFVASKVYDLGSIDVQDEQQEVVMTINKLNSWENVYVYAWDSYGTEIFGIWPGKPVTNNTVRFPKAYYNRTINYVLSTEIDPENAPDKYVQTKDKSQTLTGNFNFILPDEGSGRFIVAQYPDWGDNLYIFGGDYSINSSEWPGTRLTPHDDYAYKYYEDSDLAGYNNEFNFIVNGSGTQTKDLSTSNSNATKKNGCYYYFYSNEDKK